MAMPTFDPSYSVLKLFVWMLGSWATTYPYLAFFLAVVIVVSIGNVLQAALRVRQARHARMAVEDAVSKVYAAQLKDPK